MCVRPLASETSETNRPVTRARGIGGFATITGRMAGVSSLQARARTRVGTLLKDKWRLDALLGVGGTAAVYAASHRNGKRAAIKILHHEHSTNDELVARFLREGYVANKLGHDGAVSVLDDDRAEDGSVFLVMELLDGYSLERHTKTNAERLTLDQVGRIGDEVLDVLAIAHTKGVIHRDIKPANLFLSRDGKVKVLDFGIARLREGNNDVSATQTGAAIGTPAFMPPEQARGRWQVVDARTDIWAVGATLFALLTGSRPRRAETVNEELLLAMTEPVPRVRDLAPHVPLALAHVVDKALMFDMDARFPDARSMQAALRQAMDELRRGADPETLVAAQPDTARVVHAGARMVPPPSLSVTAESASPDTLDPRLTTSRPILTEPTAPSARRSSGRKTAAFVVVALVVLSGVGAGAFLKYGRTPSASAAAPPIAPATDHAVATSVVTAVAPPSTTAAAPGAAAAVATAAPADSSIAVAQLPVASATPKAGPKTAPHATGSGKPGAAAPTSTGNPWDSRF